MRIGLCLVCILVASPVASQQFTVGDLYLLSNSLPDGSKAILRIDPLTGASSLLTSPPSAALSTFTYDAYCDRLLYADSRTTGGLVSVDAAGNRVDLAPALPTPRFVAARGDGILYLLRSNSTAALQLLDASNVVHDVLDYAR